MNTADHLHYLHLALQLAERGRFTVSPNPMVGCLIVKNKQIVGQGYHQRAGEPHAEVLALREAGEGARGASAYLNLEPCCHQGRTPPCTEALIAAGLKKVYISCTDPNPLVAGKGITALQAAGIEVELGLAEAEAKQLNEIFFYYITHKRPFVIAKWAMSLDGKTSVAPTDSRQISCSESQLHTHQLRQQVDAILVGARTARLDNPQLTVRVGAEQTSFIKQPTRIILAGREPLALDLKVFDSQLPGKTIIASTQKKDENYFKALLSDKLELLLLPENDQGQVDLAALLTELGKREISSMLVEGGMSVHSSFFSASLVNKIQVYLAPVFIGSLPQKQALNFSTSFPLGKDFHFIANRKEVSHV